MNAVVEKFRIDYSCLQDVQRVRGEGQGVIFSADLFGQKVLVKRLNQNELPDIELIARLQHRNIVRLIGACLQPPCIITEVTGKCLAEIIKDPILISYKDFVNNCLQIACGMQYLHEQNIVHRDLKPANIFISHDGGIKITNFDVLKDASDSQIMMKTVCGTTLWMAPEMLGEHDYTRKVDVWSFGVVVWEMLTQQKPYVGIPNIAFRLMKSEVRLPFPEGISVSMRALFAGCLHSDAEARPDFSVIISVIRTTPVLDEENWHSMKEQWKTMQFDFTSKSASNDKQITESVQYLS